MGITVQNITGNTAMVIWPKTASCADSFYSIMYHPNWNSMVSSYSRKSFQKEERVPASRSSFVLENLTPLTTYILCVTCQSANPSSDQCRVFNTLERDPASASNTKKELALGIWLTSSVLLLTITAILVYGCLHLLYRRRRERLQGQPGSSTQGQGAKSAACASGELGRQSRLLQDAKDPGGIQLATIIENPSASEEPVTPASKSQERAAVTGQSSAVN
ncbi:fibronectin type III domain-containing protein 9-like [Tyto alba]|uniref:fibronectin type III domain-containing protein 9-like n=1 Tax=Tyto alba TaxID=56313 RepID=UPI001C67E4B9|nr:fibronectin type III domain-containing protein 9-like [Tyto alba]XP_042644887.1 fibronectin type III domain-containing protein 9-like [Tyto alba]XP_042644889.1 fibronectin type III domain-containing protein 9-like [Tyto alba]